MPFSGAVRSSSLLRPQVLRGRPEPLRLIQLAVANTNSIFRFQAGLGSAAAQFAETSPGRRDGRTRRYRTITIRAGNHTLTAAHPLPDELRVGSPRSLTQLRTESSQVVHQPVRKYSRAALRDRQIHTACVRVELTMRIPVALIGPFIAASVVTGPAQRVGSAPIRVWMNVASIHATVGAGGGESISQHLGPVDSVGSGHRVDSFARVDLGRPHEESRDDLYSFGYDMPSTLIRPDSYTTLLDATRSETAGEPIFDRLKIGFESH